MNEQTIFLIFLVSALAVTLGLYFLKAASRELLLSFVTKRKKQRKIQG